jgi:excisionase family DNA binding protein
VKPFGGNDEFLTVAEVAAVLRLHQQTIRNWIAAGNLPAFRLGRTLRVRRSAFERFLQDAELNTAAASLGGRSDQLADPEG